MVNDELKIWKYLKKEIGNEYGVAGLMGNLRAESALSSTNLQDSFNKAWNITDSQFTAACDSGAFDFCCNNMGAWGYGLAQWTSVGRRKNLWEFKKKKGTSIGDLDMQLEFLVSELMSSYKSVYNTLLTAKSVREASDVVLKKFEIPADQSETACKTRASYGQKYYDMYATDRTETVHLYRVNHEKGLNVRSGPGTNFERKKTLTYKTIVAVTHTAENWGYVPAHSGWICLDYTQCV